MTALLVPIHSMVYHKQAGSPPAEPANVTRIAVRLHLGSLASIARRGAELGQMQVIPILRMQLRLNSKVLSAKLEWRFGACLAALALLAIAAPHALRQQKAIRPKE